MQVEQTCLIIGTMIRLFVTLGRVQEGGETNEPISRSFTRAYRAASDNLVRLVA